MLLRCHNFVITMSLLCHQVLLCWSESSDTLQLSIKTNNKLKEIKMTHQDIADKLKEIVVNEFEKDVSDRDWFNVIGTLIDELEGKA